MIFSNICNSEQEASSVDQQRSPESELYLEREQLLAQIKELISEGADDVYLSMAINQINMYNNLRDLAQAVVGAISQLEMLSVGQIFENLGFPCDESEDL